MIGVLLIGVAALAAAALLWHSSRPRPTVVRDEYEETERSAMPLELATGTLVLSEQTLRVTRPDYLVARFDQVFATRDGRIVPVDTKTRHRAKVTLYDQIELGVQAAVLRGHLSGPLRGRVENYGYIRFAPPGRRPVYRRTGIPDDAQLSQLVRRYRSLLAGRERPQPPETHYPCARCSQRRRCPVER